VLKLKNRACAEDMRPIDDSCGCMTCKLYSRAYLHHLVQRGVPSAAILVTYHNVAYTQVGAAPDALACVSGCAYLHVSMCVCVCVCICTCERCTSEYFCIIDNTCA
jgi:hypothetical protein